VFPSPSATDVLPRLPAPVKLPSRQFFQLFAHSNRRLFDSLYATTLRPLLSPAAAEFWDGNAAFFSNVMYSGASGKLARALVGLATLAGLGPMFRALATCATLDEQRAVCAQYKPRTDRVLGFLQFVLPLLCPFAGVPASQMTLGGKDCIATFFERIFHQTVIATDNYFYHAYLYGKYTRTNCPRYLLPEHFAQLKASVDRVTVRTGLLHEVAEDFPDGYFTSMVLLDHMDWLPTPLIQGEWETFCRKLHPTRGRVLWRSFCATQHIGPLKLLDFDAEAVARAEGVPGKPERVGMYNSTYLATLPPGFLITTSDAAVAPAATAATAAQKGRLLLGGYAWADVAAALLGLLAVLRLLLEVAARALLLPAAAAKPLRRLLGKADGAARALLLPAAATPAPDPTAVDDAADADAAEAASPAGAAELMRLLPRLRGATWVDVGGGLEPSLAAVRKGAAHFGQIVLVQPSAAAAARAAATADACGLSNVTAVESMAKAVAMEGGDAALHEAAGAVSRGSVDLVTISHDLARRADWPVRLDAALALLRPGGVLAVCDAAADADAASPDDASAAAEASLSSAAVMRAFRRGARSGDAAAAAAAAAAPHAPHVLRQLRALTSEVHLEQHGASWGGVGHFVFIGRKPMPMPIK